MAVYAPTSPGGKHIARRDAPTFAAQHTPLQGYLVVCPEHADGSSSAAKLATRVTNAEEIKGVTNSGWRFYAGWGSMDSAYARTEWRRQEILTAHALVQQLNKG